MHHISTVRTCFTTIQIGGIGYHLDCISLVSFLKLLPAEVTKSHGSLHSWGLSPHMRDSQQRRRAALSMCSCLLFFARFNVCKPSEPWHFPPVISANGIKAGWGVFYNKAKKKKNVRKPFSPCVKLTHGLHPKRRWTHDSNEISDVWWFMDELRCCAACPAEAWRASAIFGSEQLNNFEASDPWTASWCPFSLRLVVGEVM